MPTKLIPMHITLPAPPGMIVLIPFAIFARANDLHRRLWDDLLALVWAIALGSMDVACAAAATGGSFALRPFTHDGAVDVSDRIWADVSGACRYNISSELMQCCRRKIGHTAATRAMNGILSHLASLYFSNESTKRD